MKSSSSSNNEQEASLRKQIEYLEMLLKTSPENPWLSIELCHLYLANKQILQAKNLAQELLDRSSLESNPAIVAACLYTLGLVSLSNDDNEKAINWLTSSLQIWKSLNEPWYLAQTYYHLGVAHLARFWLSQWWLRRMKRLPKLTQLHLPIHQQ